MSMRRRDHHSLGSALVAVLLASFPHCSGAKGSVTRGRMRNLIGRRHVEGRGMRTRMAASVDPDIVKQQAIMLSTVGGVAGYWWFVLVPSERQRLSKNKRSGEISEYLEDLKRNPHNRQLEAWFLQKWLSRTRVRENVHVDASQSPGVLEKEPFADDVNFKPVDVDINPVDVDNKPVDVDINPVDVDVNSVRNPGNENRKPGNENRNPGNENRNPGNENRNPGITELFSPPVSKTPRFWSLDNPVLAASGLLVVFGLLSTASEKLSMIIEEASRATG
ncbi:hypothetical protein AAMO2058_000469500 [Amorphochlora amoebiformis]